MPTNFLKSFEVCVSTRYTLPLCEYYCDQSASRCLSIGWNYVDGTCTFYQHQVSVEASLSPLCCLLLNKVLLVGRVHVEQRCFPATLWTLHQPLRRTSSKRANMQKMETALGVSPVVCWRGWFQSRSVNSSLPSEISGIVSFVLSVGGLI